MRRCCARPLKVGDEAVVEWRALTVTLIDELAPLVRRRLGVDAAQMPLACVLEGGTWAAGRETGRRRCAAAGRRSRSKATARCSERAAGGRRPASVSSTSDTAPVTVAWMLAYFSTGAFVGLLAGLLGIGGGMTLVPVLAVMFTAQQLAPDHTVHLALGTGMASIMFTSSSSVFTHHRLGGVDWSLVRRMGPGMVLGTLLATALSGWVSQRALALAFAVIVYAGATQILLGRKPSAGRTLPGPPALFGIGSMIGVVCGLVSAGGAFMTVPFMLFCGVAMTTAIGTGAALGVPVAIVGHARLPVEWLARRRSATARTGFRAWPGAVGDRRRKRAYRADRSARRPPHAGGHAASHFWRAALHPRDEDVVDLPLIPALSNSSRAKSSEPRAAGHSR